MRRAPPSVAHWFRKFGEFTRPVRYAEVPRIGHVEHLEPHLHVLPVRKSRVLREREIDVADAVGAQQVTRGVADAFTPGQAALGMPHRRRKSVAPPAARISSTVILDRSLSVFRFGLMALPTRPSIPASAPVGSEPFKGVNGAPLCAVKKEPNCQPPSSFAAKPSWLRMNGSSQTKLPNKMSRDRRAALHLEGQPCTGARHRHRDPARVVSQHRRVASRSVGRIHGRGPR